MREPSKLTKKDYIAQQVRNINFVRIPAYMVVGRCDSGRWKLYAPKPWLDYLFTVPARMLEKQFGGAFYELQFENWFKFKLYRAHSLKEEKDCFTITAEDMYTAYANLAANRWSDEDE